jgi:hypothetical protein
MNLADPAERLQMTGKLRLAHGDANAPADLRQRAHDVAAEKARAAENRGQTIARCCRHA